MGKPESIYIVWKCPESDYRQLLDDAGGPLPHERYPSYEKYLADL